MLKEIGRGGKIRLSRLSLPERVAEQLREMIVTGELGWGEKVPVAALATQLGVSPTPLREALKALAAEELVELLPNRGARVAAYTPDDARQLFEVIAGLESLAAELATQRMGARDLEALERRHAEMRAAFGRRERDAYFALNSEIHAAIVALSANEVLKGAHRRLTTRASRGRFVAILDAARWDQAMAEHEAVMEAFRARDWRAAAAIWRTHLQNTGAATMRALAAAEAGEGRDA